MQRRNIPHCLPAIASAKLRRVCEKNSSSTYTFLLRMCTNATLCIAGSIILFGSKNAKALVHVYCRSLSLPQLGVFLITGYPGSGSRTLEHEVLDEHRKNPAGNCMDVNHSDSQALSKHRRMLDSVDARASVLPVSLYHCKFSAYFVLQKSIV